MIEIVKAGAERIDDLEPLWHELVLHQRAMLPVLGPVRERADTWERRRRHYAELLAKPGAFALLAVRAGALVGYAMVDSASRHRQRGRHPLLPPARLRAHVHRADRPDPGARQRNRHARMRPIRGAGSPPEGSPINTTIGFTLVPRPASTARPPRTGRPSLTNS